MFGEERAGAKALKEVIKQNIKASINIVTFQAVFAYPKTSDVAED